MLTSITIKNFRTFKDVTVPLKPLTVFIGANNSGKTNAIRAIELIAAAAGKSWWADQSGPSQRGAPATIEVAGEFRNTKFKALLKGATPIEPLGTAALEFSGEVNWKPAFAQGNQQGTQAPGGHQFASPNAAAFVMNSLIAIQGALPEAFEFFRGVRIASLSVPKLREPSPVSKDPILGERGENFGAVLDWASGKPSLFRSINAELQRVLKVDGCTTLVTDHGMKIAAINEGDQSFGADVISDGVLLYMGLTTVAHLVGPNSLLIIEEPENGIHPRRLKDLLEQIRSIQKRGTQVILTTHSPILLDEFSDEPESIVVFDRDPSGATHVSQPAPEQLKAVLNGDFGLGSLWFSGAIGGVPA